MGSSCLVGDRVRVPGKKTYDPGSRYHTRPPCDISHTGCSLSKCRFCLLQECFTVQGTGIRTRSSHLLLGCVLLPSPHPTPHPKHRAVGLSVAAKEFKFQACPWAKVSSKSPLQLTSSRNALTTHSGDFLPRQTWTDCVAPAPSLRPLCHACSVPWAEKEVAAKLVLSPFFCYTAVHNGHGFVFTILQRVVSLPSCVSPYGLINYLMKVITNPLHHSITCRTNVHNTTAEKQNK